MRQWHFYEKVYRRWLVLFVGSFEDFQKEMQNIGYDGASELYEARGMCIDLNVANNTSGQNCAVIWLREWHLADLIHETTHFVMFCFDELGIPMERNNTETFAFYTEYWFNEISRVRRRTPEGRTPSQARASSHS